MARDEMVQSAINNWAPRFISNGTDANDFQCVTNIHRLKGANVEDSMNKLKQFNLQGVAEKIERPLLVIQGVRDRLVPAEQSKRTAADVGSRATFRLFEDSNHVCNGIPYNHRPQQADWMREHLFA